MSGGPRVLVVDDDEAFRETLASRLRQPELFIQIALSGGHQIRQVVQDCHVIRRDGQNRAVVLLRVRELLLHFLQHRQSGQGADVVGLLGDDSFQPAHGALFVSCLFVERGKD